MLEPDSFATNNLFPAGKSEKNVGLHGVSWLKRHIAKKPWHGQLRKAATFASTIGKNPLFHPLTLTDRENLSSR